MSEWLNQPVPIHLAILGVLAANAIGWGLAFWWQSRYFKRSRSPRIYDSSIVVTIPQEQFDRLAE